MSKNVKKKKNWKIERKKETHNTIRWGENVNANVINISLVEK